mmetsp:Transcript_31980/g.71852  ORF Transcript_31980/g.71852 Transcript_31980/m.71852 type:complete len:262 (-) Transcript_31980:128-913(-)
MGKRLNHGKSVTDSSFLPPPSTSSPAPSSSLSSCRPAPSPSSPCSCSTSPTSPTSPASSTSPWSPTPLAVDSAAPPAVLHTLPSRSAASASSSSPIQLIALSSFMPCDSGEATLAELACDLIMSSKMISLSRTLGHFSSSSATFAYNPTSSTSMLAVCNGCACRTGDKVLPCCESCSSDFATCLLMSCFSLLISRWVSVRLATIRCRTSWISLSSPLFAAVCSLLRNAAAILLGRAEIDVSSVFHSANFSLKFICNLCLSF